jgi:hypothetical protein
MADLFITEFRNETDKDYLIYENGQPFGSVPPQETRIIESESAKTTYARFSEVLIRRDGIAVRERPGWQDPFQKGEFVLEMINVNGAPQEQRIVGGMVVHLPRGIPVRVVCPLTDPLIFFERVEIKRSSERVRDPRCPGYLFRQAVLRDFKTSRPEPTIQRIIALITGEGLEVPAREQPAEELDVLYECEVENKKDKKEKKEDEESVLIRAENGRSLVRLQPGQKVILEMFDARCIYSRFKKIVFEEGGEVKLTENHRWKSPYNGRTIELYNRHSPATQAVTLGGKEVYAFPGIPVIAEVALQDGDVFYKSIRWERTTKKRPKEGFPGYSEVVTQLECIREPRSEKEIRELRLQRAGIVDKKAEAEKSKIMEGK